MESENTFDFESSMDEHFLENIEIDSFVEEFMARPPNCVIDISVFDFVKPTREGNNEIESYKEEIVDKEENKENTENTKNKENTRNTKNTERTENKENIPKEQRTASSVGYDILCDLEEKRKRIISGL